MWVKWSFDRTFCTDASIHHHHTKEASEAKIPTMGRRGGRRRGGWVGLDLKLLWALCRFISLTMQWGGPLCSLDLGPGSKSKCVIGAICGHKYTPTASHNLNTKKQHFVLWILRIEWSVTQSLNTIQNRVQFTLNLLQDRVYKALMLFGDAIY